MDDVCTWCCMRPSSDTYSSPKSYSPHLVRVGHAQRCVTMRSSPRLQIFLARKERVTRRSSLESVSTPVRIYFHQRATHHFQPRSDATGSETVLLANVSNPHEVRLRHGVGPRPVPGVEQGTSAYGCDCSDCSICSDGRANVTRVCESVVVVISHSHVAFTPWATDRKLAKQLWF